MTPTQAKPPSTEVVAYKAMNHSLETRVAAIESVLPDNMKGQAERLIKRAMLTFSKRPELMRNCPQVDFVRCVIEAAEIGLAIDGKLAHVVQYKQVWQMIPDYKGLIAVAKRGRQILDCIAGIVCQNDHFRHWRENAKDNLEHEIHLGQDRGEVIAAYATVIRPDGGCRHEVLDRDELDRVQAAAPSKKGPWLTYPNEMRKKTAVRRCLKTYCDDPGVIRCAELMDQEYGQAPEASALPSPRQQHWADATVNAPPVAPAAVEPEVDREPGEDIEEATW